MRRRVLSIIGALAVVVVAAVAFVLWPRSATPVTKTRALADFRSTPSTTLDRRSAATPRHPEEGVYTYAAEGGEEVKLGVLPTEVRKYPAEVPAVVVPGDSESCFTLTLNLIQQHTEDTTYCTSADAKVRLVAHAKHQRIGPLSPSAQMTCDPNLLRDGSRQDSALECTLELSGGPVAVTARLRGRSRAGVPETVEVSGAQVEAVPLDINYSVSGGLTGTWHERLWLAVDTSMPLRIERDLTLSGPATFKEHSVLVLQSQQPAR